MTTRPPVEVAEGENPSARPTRRFGRFRLLAVGIALGLAAMIGVSTWRLRSLDGIPDVGDPFDVDQAIRSVEVPDEENAYVLFGEATRELIALPATMAKVDFPALTWSKSAQAIRDYLEQNRPAIETWRRGSERPEALYHRPGALRIDTILPVVQDMRILGRLGGLEGTRLEEQGAMEQAWGWYRAMLRCSRLVGRHGVLMERAIGSSWHSEAARRIVAWAADPRVDAALLRRALENTLEADALTPPISDALKLEYLMYLRDLRELRVMTTDIPLPGGPAGILDRMASSAGMRAPIQRFWLRASNDAERSRRAARMLFANWLAQVDRPASERVPLALRSPILIYTPDPAAPAVARALPPERLAEIVDHNALARHVFGDYPFFTDTSRTALWEEGGALGRERRRRSALIVRLAAELYRREHRQYPSTAGVLVGPYLEDLPAGIAGDDPIPTAVD